MKRIKLYALFLLCWLSSVAFGQVSPQNTALAGVQRFVVEAGMYAEDFFYTHTQDTRLTTDAYRPDGWEWTDSPKDVFYRITLETPMVVLVDIEIGLGLDTGVAYYLEEDTITGILTPIPRLDGHYFDPSVQVVSLQKGTYYVVAEGPVDDNGVAINDIMTTTITAIPYRYEVPLGSFSTHTRQTLTGDTRRTSSEYGDPSRNDIYYNFSLNSPMSLSVNLNSFPGPDEFSNINLYIFNDLNKEIASVTGESSFEGLSLLWGNYYLMIEGMDYDGMLSVDLELKPLEISIDLGKVSETKTFSETFNTTTSENVFGLSTNEIFYKLQLTQELDISISNRSSTDSTDAAVIYLLDAKGNIIRSTQDGRKGLTVKNCPAGIYYIVSEGKYRNMSIVTEISTTYQTLHSDRVKHNYIMTHTYTQTNGSDSLVNIDYFDGLGRLSNSVHVGASPSGLDIITRQDYDNFGRRSRQWLPRVSGYSNGKYLTPKEFESLSSVIYNHDTHPYSMPVYESSPLNRVVEQYGPGQDWYSKGASVSTAYKANVAGNAVLNCKLYVVSGTSQNPTLLQSGNYATGELYVTEVKDEDGNTTYEFKDKLGQVVLTRQMKENVAHDTYYVYDDFGNKCFVLPPRIQDEGITQTKLDELAYQYRYDVRNRQIAKKLPGSGWIYYVYDKADRLIFSQDSIQRQKGEWMFMLPDAFGRVVVTGICKNPVNVTNTFVKVAYSSTGGYKGYYILIDGSTRAVGTSPVILSANYYDNYDFRGALASGIPLAGTEYNTETGYGTQYVGGAQGLLTGKLTAQLNADGTPSSTYLYSVMYYDNRRQVIQTKSNNPLAEGIEQEYLAYDFVGNVIQRKHVHQAGGKTPQTEIYKYEYDPEGRLLTATHQLNDGVIIKLADNEYDELGRLMTDRRNGNTTLKTDYEYNVRSWTKVITNPLFSQTLYYNDKRGNGTLNTPAYNGNISGMDWTGGKGYNFTYDNLSRLTNAFYLENNVISRKFSTSYSYDKHGNMLALSRNGNQPAAIDNLTFTYQGNQLMRTDDTATNPTQAGSMDFRDGTNTGDDYAYDPNGNLAKDLNKNITDIKYNVLNLPSKVTFGNGNSVSYVYAADGSKLQTMHIINGTTTTTDYVGNMIYENGTLKRILVDCGYYEHDGYYFYIQDHLGNNRVVAKQDGSAVQTNEFYPYGMTFAESTSVDAQPYKYNGKELDTKNGLNWYDYGARHYDAAICRWHVVDPMAEEYYSSSPYAYCVNNPIKHIDPDGRTIVIWYKNKNGSSSSFTYSGGNVTHSNPFVQSVITAYQYNKANGIKAGNGGGASTVAIVENTKIRVNVTEAIYDVTYSPDAARGAGSIYWKSDWGSQRDNGVVNSPATLFDHEASHALEHKTNPEEYEKNRMQSDLQYHTKEERRVITGSEQKTSRANGETRPGQVTRRNHNGKRVITKGVTSNIIDRLKTKEYEEREKEVWTSEP